MSIQDAPAAAQHSDEWARRTALASRAATPSPAYGPSRVGSATGAQMPHPQTFSASWPGNGQQRNVAPFAGISTDPMTHPAPFPAQPMRANPAFHLPPAGLASLAELGTPLPVVTVPRPTTGAGNGVAVAGVAVGVFALLIGWIPVVCFSAFFLAVGGVACSGLGLSQALHRGRRAAAITGLAVSATAIVLAAVMSLVSLALIASAAEPDVAPAPVSRTESAPASGQPTTAPGDGSSRLGEDPTGDRIYLASVERINVRSLSDAAAVDMAYELCDRAAAGDGLTELDRYVSDRVDVDPIDGAVIAGAAIGSYCPEHMGQLR